MGPGPTESVGSPLDGANLLQIHQIPASAPSQDLLQCILEHEKNGMPLVITGVHFDQHWHSQPSLFLGVNPLASRETGTVSTRIWSFSNIQTPIIDDAPAENDASAILPLLETLSLIPEHLLPRATDTGPSQVIKDLKQENGGEGASV